MRTEVVIVASCAEEREGLRPFFPDSTIVVPGNTCSGCVLSSAIVTPSVDISTAWFGTRIVARLAPGAEIFMITPRAKVPHAS
ncbi:hypothetical protein vBRpoSV10_208 [Ruegeria phage vB_RpoS-V10]|nr:hypothetical protein DSS3P8_203 [Roseobacter phage DSS3P8]AWY09330.1 hypothetical protein vBRpoSV10_208 [Ruegeria phage vB_RpoS-V10]